MHERSPFGMSMIVRVVARWLFGLILVYGLAVAVFGHLTPGGGFAGGVILAGGLALAVLAFGAKQGPAGVFRRWAASLDGVGALAFLTLALLGLFTGHSSPSGPRAARRTPCRAPSRSSCSTSRSCSRWARGSSPAS